MGTEVEIRPPRHCMPYGHRSSELWKVWQTVRKRDLPVLGDALCTTQRGLSASNATAVTVGVVSSKLPGEA